MTIKTTTTTIATIMATTANTAIVTPTARPTLLEDLVVGVDEVVGVGEAVAVLVTEVSNYNNYIICNIVSYWLVALGSIQSLDFYFHHHIQDY